MTFCLNSIIIKPENGLRYKNAVILLHGYGGDGKDISMLIFELEKTYAKHSFYLSKWT